jgi:hypothetical protein
MLSPGAAEAEGARAVRAIAKARVAKRNFVFIVLLLSFNSLCCSVENFARFGGVRQNSEQSG